MEHDAAILYYLRKKVLMVSVPAKSKATFVREIDEELQITVMGIKFRTYESIFLNNHKVLHFITTKEIKHNNIIIRESKYFNTLFQYLNLLFANFLLLFLGYNFPLGIVFVFIIFTVTLNLYLTWTISYQFISKDVFPFYSANPELISIYVDDCSLEFPRLVIY